MKMIFTALVSVILFASSEMALAGAVATVKPYYDLSAKERYYDLSVEISRHTLWDHLSYVSIVGGEWFPAKGMADRNSVRTEQGISVDVGSLAVGLGVAHKHYPFKAAEQRQVFGSLFYVLWE